MEATALGLDQKKYKALSWALKGFGVVRDRGILQLYGVDSFNKGKRGFRILGQTAGV